MDQTMDMFTALYNKHLQDPFQMDKVSQHKPGCRSDQAERKKLLPTFCYCKDKESKRNKVKPPKFNVLVVCIRL